MRKLFQQFLKFFVVGASAFVIDYGGLMLLSQVLGFDAVVSAAVSYCASTVYNYLASMRFVFTHRDDISKRREFFTFVVLSVIGLGLNEVIMYIGVLMVGDSGLMVTAIKLVATCIVSVWNFFSRRHWLDAGDEGA